MSRPRWDNPEDYRFTETLSVAQWMWEFLRRNSAYREDWEWFNETWQLLESRYGKPPNRDFSRWEADPLAYRQANDEDRVLIECWMGEKWGFYKFPLSPDTDIPLIGEQLTWREVEWPAVKVGVAATEYLGAADDKIALGFDLELPLRQQLETAKRFLQARQARLKRAKVLILRTLESQRERWRSMLRLLDAQAIRVDEASLRNECAAWLGGDDDLNHFRVEADALVNGRYRELLRIPEPGATR